MLKLEKLEVRGFKSFFDTTEIKFHEGITAVVGPNGCGKSNILDSIAWVLGEQSAKSLRGSKMEDVIFNGTSTRKALSLAEVTLTLIATQDISARNLEIDDIEIKESNLEIEAFSNIKDTNANIENDAKNDFVTSQKITNNTNKSTNKKKIPNVAAGEKITVSRRLYRSGDSDYLMNGHSCRLRDIHDFFAGTGLGGAQYAIIEQGHIGQILSSKPQDRRALIEEAAGITKFKAKKHLAEVKLEATKQNLSRLNDILAEVERQIAILKKQAAKARRYRRLREHIRHYLKYIFINEFYRLKELLSNIEINLKTLLETEEKLSIEFNNQEINYRNSQLEIDKITETLEQAKTHSKDLQIESERTISRLTHQKEQEKDVEIRIFQSEKDIENTFQKININKDEILNSSEELEKVNIQINELSTKLSSQETVYRSSQTELLGLEKELEQLQNQLLIEVSKTEKLKNLKQQLLDNQKRTERHKEYLNNDLKKAQEQVLSSKSDYEQLRKNLSNSEDRVESFLAELDSVNDELQIAKQKTLERQKTLNELTREHSRTEDRLNSLNQLNEKQAYFSESVQKLLGNKKIQAQFNLVGTLADILNVLPRNEMLVEQLLGDILQTILVNNINDAVNAMDWLAKQKANKVGFLLIDNKKFNGKINDTATDNQNLLNLLDLLGLSDKHQVLFRQVFPELSKALIINDLANALEFSINNQDILVFTLQGEQVRGGKLLVTKGSTTSTANVLQLKREIKQLSDSLIDLETEKDKAIAQLTKQKEKELSLEEKKKEIDSLLRSEEKTLAARRVELSQGSKDLERNQQQIKSITLQLEQTEKEIVNLEEKLKLTTEDVIKAENYRQEIQEKLEKKKIEIAKLKPNVELASQKFSELRTLNATQQERKKAFLLSLKKLEDEREQLKKHSEEVSSTVIQLKERKEELKDSLIIAENVASNLEKEIVLAKKNVEIAESKLAKAREIASDQEEVISKLRKQIAEIKENKSSAQVEKAKLESQLDNLAQNCLNELSENIINLVENKPSISSELENEIIITDVANAQQLLLETRNKLSDLGPVNMMALDELTETEQRQSFLQQQYTDILESINATEEALREIKIRSRIKFREAFEKININFSEMFQELFGGGRGEMFLINEDDVLESGIDIIAQPPGKKLQNILLLSGGEKAMTALALVLGIFRFRPSPFCVLDEVDAPLDDINIGRFTYKIKQMSEMTQFLVITHSKRTMEVASSIYGVTMQEPGVSKLISVRLG
ncbi:MAG: chromosome segregation protein SMC [Acidobacteria bacterium]|nr:chromosome segregation protein SMC [Acidobacteriota bacterium]